MAIIYRKVILHLKLSCDLKKWQGIGVITDRPSNEPLAIFPLEEKE